MEKLFLFLVMILLGWDFVLAQESVRLVKEGVGYQVLGIWCPQIEEYQKFYRYTGSANAYIKMEKVAEDVDIPVEQLRQWGFANRQDKLWRGEFAPLQELWRPLSGYPVYAVFYHQSQRVDETGYNFLTTPSVVPQSDYQEFMRVWQLRNEPDIPSAIHFGEVLKWMVFKVKDGLKVYPNCYCLYFQVGGTFPTLSQLPSCEWSDSEFGIMADCGNTYRRYIKPPEVKVIVLPIEIVKHDTIYIPAKLPPSICRTIFAESAIFGGYSELNPIRGTNGNLLGSQLWYGGQESSFTYSESRGAARLWLNLIGDWWRLKDTGKPINTGFQLYLGPQVRIPISYYGILKTSVNVGYRWAYERHQPFIRPRLNLEVYNLFWKLGLSTEWDYMYSLDKTWPEKLYFGNTMLFYSPRYGRKYGLGIEYAKVNDGVGYWSSGAFFAGKIEGLFGADWLHLVGKFRIEKTTVNHYSYPPNPQLLYTDNLSGSRWMLLLAIVLKK